jgi:enoyl-[acyl-carrier protein] reductase II
LYFPKRFIQSFQLDVQGKIDFGISLRIKEKIIRSFVQTARSMENRLTKLLNIKYPIIQAGMIWCSGWELASASSNAGGLGVIGAGSMYPDVLRTHIAKAKAATSKPFGVNVPLLYPDIEELIDIVLKAEVPIVITSAGNPGTWTAKLKAGGCTVIHVIANQKFALKAVAAGVDAVVAEGFEAGGHNGIEETTTMCLIPEICSVVDVPVIAAGGIGSGRAIAAAMALGADGVQIGSRFVASKESSAHQNFKSAVVEAKGGSTKLMLKDLMPVRLLRNPFFQLLQEADERCATKEEKLQILGRARAKRGMFEGNLDEGELEIGQVSAMLSSVESVADIFKSLVDEYNVTIKKLKKMAM